VADESGLILVVDDNPTSRYTITRVLRHAGYGAVEAASGREALEAVTKEKPDLVLLDVKLPDISGYEVCRRIKLEETYRSLPVVHLTASFADDVSKARGLEGGADGYLTHPIEPHVLIATIRSLLSIPLDAARRTIGALTLLSIESSRNCSDEDTLLAEQLAFRAAAALVNSRLFGELQRADRAKEEFLAILAHELRNPLEPILTAACVLQLSDAPRPATDRARDVILRQSRQMARLTDDLLDISRINTGTIELRSEVVELGALVRETADDYRAQLESHDVTLHLELPPEGVFVRADSARLAQVIGNLLHNAAKFSAGGSVVVSARRDNGNALLAVRDDGIGIEPHVIGKLFEPFQQGTSTFDRGHGGLGLGLSLARGIVALHGGTIEAASAGSGRGSQFVITLPVTTDRIAEPVSETVVERRPLRVLIVEDNHDAASALSDFLELSGHETRVVSSGSGALEAARQMKPDVVLCDLGLPGMDGFEVARALRADPLTAETYLVALSGYGQKDDRDRSRQSGFDIHLTKPVHPTVLETMLLTSRREEGTASRVSG
jgi:signal transduction histidine kinase